MGVHGMDARAGFTCPNLLEAETDIALIAAGRRLVVVADHTKWGVVGIASIARLDQADVLISDTALDAEAQAVAAGERAGARPRRCGGVVGLPAPGTGRVPARGEGAARAH